MSPSFANWDERTLDLACDQVTVGLSDAHRDELGQLARPEDVEEFEGCVAAIHLASLARLEPPPPAVLDRLHADARRRFVPPPASRAWQPVVLGLLAVAAVVLVLLRIRPADPSLTDRRTALLGRGDVVQVAWAGTDDPLAAGVSGDVVWSDAAQEGYMRFRGLEPNDPTQAQYQLWVFDPTRPSWEERPVDGGVFDVPAGEEVVVPIDAKIPVGRAALFAVTLEAPGGVVVSERERLVVTAAVE